MRMVKSNVNASYGIEKDVDSDVESINCCQLNVHKAKIRESRSKYHNYPEKRLFQRRSCTDILFLILFLGCLGGWCYLGYYAISSTPINEIFIPTDSRNRRCGLDDGVKKKPNVFYFDFLKCVPPRSGAFQCNTPKVCVEKCPTESFYLNLYIDSSSINEIRNKLICVDGFNKAAIYNKESAIRAVQENRCAEWYLESVPIFRRCLYDQSHVGNHLQLFGNCSSPTHFRFVFDTILSYFLSIMTYKNDIYKVIKNTGEEIKVGFERFGKRFESSINKITGNDVYHASKVLLDINEFGQGVFRDLKNVWPWIVVYVSIISVFSFIYIAIMRWVSRVMVWLSIIASIGLLAYSTYYTWTKYRELAQGNPPLPSYYSHFHLIEIFGKKETWLAFFILSIIFLSFILITIIFLRSRINLAVELIREGSKAVINSWSAVVFPIFPWIIQMAAVAYGLLIFAYLINSGIPVRKVLGLNGSSECRCENNYKEGSYCTQEAFNKFCHSVNTKLPCRTASCVFSEGDTQRQALYLQMCNLFMVLWSLFFSSGFGQMVLASTFATYYWTFNKDSLPVFVVGNGVWKVIRYHLGTVSLGSLLLAFCNWIRIIIEYIYNYVNKYDNNCVKVVKCCCSCVFWCLNAFLKFLNKNAYIMCAIHGKNFCSSARHAFNLLIRNVLRVAILDRVTNFLFFLGKIMVTTASGIIAFYFFSKPVPPISDPFNTTNGYIVEYYFVPVSFICITAYFISSLFFGVYSMAVETLFLCAMEDLEMNDGSPERPYFMSKNLMKILRKKNKVKIK